MAGDWRSGGERDSAGLEGEGRTQSRGGPAEEGGTAFGEASGAAPGEAFSAANGEGWSGYRKELYVFDGGRPARAVVRNYTEADFPELIRIQGESFPPPFPSELWWNEEQLRNHVTLFPQGALCVEVEGTLAGSMTGLRVDFDPAHAAHTWEEITDGGYIRNHNPAGGTLYVVDICIRPAHRKLGLGYWLMQSMYETVVRLGLVRLLGGGRMPGYGRHAEELTPEQYVQQVLAGTLKDPVITFLLRCGRTPLQVIPGYLEDEDSLNHAVLMEWRNPFLRE